MIGMARVFQVEYHVTDTVAHDRAQTPRIYHHYSLNGDLAKAQKSLKKALKQPGAVRYSWQIRNLETQQKWVWLGDGFLSL